MSEFAKLFGSGDDQALAMVWADDEGNPEVRIFWQPKGLGICSVALGFNDTDRGWELADEAFANLSEDKARSIIAKATESTGFKLLC